MCRPHTKTHKHTYPHTFMYSGVNIQYDDHILRPSEIAMGIYTQSYGPLATDFVNYVNNSIQICRHC